MVLSLNCVFIQTAEMIAARKPKVRQVMAYLRQEMKVTGAGVRGFSAHLPGGQAQPEKALTMQSAEISVPPQA